MSGIFGIARRDGAELDPRLIDALATGMASWARDGRGLWSGDGAALGQARTFCTPEGCRERQPVVDRAGFAFTSEARLDNLVALRRELGLSCDACDGDVVLGAYRRWGEGASARLLGDWSFAAWHPGERRLVLARDHISQTALYYRVTGELVAFASSRAALQALGLAPVMLDELYIAQYLVSWTAYHGARTSDRAIRRVPPAHTVTVTPEAVHSACYWRLEDAIEPVGLPSRADYVACFRELFEDAVQSRLRATGPLGAELSGGLDSSSVTVTAAGLIRPRGDRIQAFTSVPAYDVAPFEGARFGDELALARASAKVAGNVDHHPVTACGLTPVGAIRRWLELFGAPVHAAGSAYWLIGLPQTARGLGCRIVLTGRRGNVSVSWRGDPSSQRWRDYAAAHGWRRAARARARRRLPPRLARIVARRRLPPDWHRASAIHPDLVSRLDLVDRWLAEPEWHPVTPLATRLAILMPGRAALLSAEVEAHAGLAFVDPTADVRVLTLTMGVPDRLFIDPRTGTDRWLIREAMRGRLPAEVLSNRRLGLQSADLVPRLRASADEVDAVLDELDGSSAAAYVDVAHMRDSWRAVRERDGYDTHVSAVSVLTRGIMAGLHVNALSG